MPSARLVLGLVAAACAAGCLDFRSAESEAASSLQVSLTEVASVGQLDGPPEQVLGVIRDVVALPDGSFVVLDGQTPAIRRYSEDGTHLAGITSVGDGPGELGTPRAITVREDGLLGVLDTRRQHLALHRMSSGGFEYEGAIPLSMSPYDYRDRNVCGARGRWYVQQGDPESLIRSFDAEGVQIQAFQPPELTSREELGAMAEIADVVMNSGMLLCDPDANLLVSMTMRSDTVRAFDLEGTPRWKTAIPGLIRETYVLGENGQTGPVGTPDGAHLGESIVDWGEAAILVQYRFWRGQRSDPDETRIESYALSKSSGEVLARSETLPEIAEVSGDFVYLIETLPYPRVRVMRR